MNYDFKTLTDRKIQASYKWNLMIAEYPQTIDEGIVPLSSADMEFKHPPKLIKGMQEYLSDLILGYSYASESYKSAVLSWMKRRHNYLPKEDSLINTFGIVPALFTAIRAFSKEGDGVALMPPVYGPFFMAIEKNNRKPVRCNLINSGTKWEIDFEKLELLFKTEKPKILLFCSPHNPIGKVWTSEELKKVSDLCLKYKVVLVSDEIHHDLVLKSSKNNHIVLENVSEDISENCVICTSLAKTFNIAGVPLSAIFIKNKNLRERFQIELDKIHGVAKPCLGFKLNEIAYNFCEDWLEEALAVIEENISFVKDYLAKNLPEVKTFDLDATYLLWLDFRKFNFSQEKLMKILKDECRLFLTTGTFFGDVGTGFARMNLASPKFVIEDATKRLCDTFKKLL